MRDRARFVVMRPQMLEQWRNILLTRFDRALLQRPSSHYDPLSLAPSAIHQSPTGLTNETICFHITASLTFGQAASNMIVRMTHDSLGFVSHVYVRGRTKRLYWKGAISHEAPEDPDRYQPD
jgi:hypothetical protein